MGRSLGKYLYMYHTSLNIQHMQHTLQTAGSDSDRRVLDIFSMGAVLSFIIPAILPKCHNKHLKMIKKACDKLKDSIDAFIRTLDKNKNNYLGIEHSARVYEINLMIQDLGSLYELILKEDLTISREAIERQRLL